MSAASPDTHDLAERILAHEAGRPESPDAHADAALRVCEKLRLVLSRLAGVEGYTSLMGRALALAQAESPSLRGVRIGVDGSLEGFDEGEGGDSGTAGAPGAVLVAQLLGLLVTFIGEPLTLRLVRDAWPDAFTEASASTNRDHP